MKLQSPELSSKFPSESNDVLKMLWVADLFRTSIVYLFFIMPIKLFEAIC